MQSKKVFVIHSLKSIIVKLATCKNSLFLLVFVVAEQAGLSLTWLKKPSDRWGSVFIPCFAVHCYVNSSSAIILMGKRELVALLCLPGVL